MLMRRLNSLRDFNQSQSDKGQPIEKWPSCIEKRLKQSKRNAAAFKLPTHTRLGIGYQGFLHHLYFSFPFFYCLVTLFECVYAADKAEVIPTACFPIRDLIHMIPDIVWNDQS